MVTRRDTLKSLLLTGMVISAPNSLRRLNAAESSRTQPLKIPALETGTLAFGERSFSLSLQAGVTRFYQDVETPTWGINGTYLGPTLRMRDGENIRIQVQNGLDEHSILHWHGMNVPARADGGPHQRIEPGATWRPEFQVRQPAASCWYHAHTMHRSGPQVYRGLAGMLIVDDEESDQSGLPSEYGVDDIPLIIQDRIFDGNGHFVYPERMQDHMAGVRGNTLLVNGTLNPSLRAQRPLTRLRVLNGANARNFTLGLSTGASFWQIATDCGYLEQPVELKQIVLTPGERVEILVDTRGTNPFKLVNIPVPEPNIPYYGLFTDLLREMDRQAFDILEIQPSGIAADHQPAIPERLTTIAWLPEQSANATRTIRLQMGNGPGQGGGLGGGPHARRQYGGWGGGVHKINGREMDPAYIEATIIAGSTEIWEIINETPMIHPFHIHKVHFQILDRNGAPPLPSERGFKDTVNVPALGSVRIIAQFTGPGDPLMPYMFHCHILEHEDHGMMGQFILV
ncbi:MAG: multicopper oxidase domain-containing protein [Pseudomonadales bacterium]|nr:multicopper oxidase domain-containing protein [Pseudomonadales bacterium]MCP5357111.1 multicopper oxidase domain-containing protein [Pseudomonadales bacterium]